MKHRNFVLGIVAALGIAGAANAAEMKGMPGTATPAAGIVTGKGVVKSIDVAASKVTIAHEPIEAIKWPAMTMGFKVAEPAMLGNVAVGRKIEFVFDSKDQQFTIKSIKVIE